MTGGTLLVLVDCSAVFSTIGHDIFWPSARVWNEWYYVTMVLLLLEWTVLCGECGTHLWDAERFDLLSADFNVCMKLLREGSCGLECIIISVQLYISTRPSWRYNMEILWKQKLLGPDKLKKGWGWTLASQSSLSEGLSTPVITVNGMAFPLKEQVCDLRSFPSRSLLDRQAEATARGIFAQL